jgi:G3E family GTPase
MANAPDNAVNFSQAGGSSRMESAGVWWASMPFEERITYQDFVENKDYIEGKWSKDFGDRVNELVFIAQNFDKDDLQKQLETCLITDDEVLLYKSGYRFDVV